MGAARDGRPAGRADCRKALTDENEYVRGWAIQLALDREQADAGEVAAAIRRRWPRTIHRPSCGCIWRRPLQRLPLDDRWAILERLARHAEDAGDHNLPLMYWYAAEPLAEADPQRALAFGLVVRQDDSADCAISCCGGSRSIDRQPALAALVDGSGKSDRRRRTAGDSRRHPPGACAGQRQRRAAGRIGRPLIGKLWPATANAVADRGDRRSASRSATRPRWRRCASSSRRRKRTPRHAAPRSKSLLAAKDPQLAADAADAARRCRAARRRRSWASRSTTIRRRRRKLLAAYPQLVAAGKAGGPGDALRRGRRTASRC